MYFEEIKQLAALLKESDLTEIEVERDGMRLKVVKSRATDNNMYSMQLPQPIVSSPVSTQVETAVQAVQDNLFVIKSPIVGTLYMSSSPDAVAFVDRGSKINANSVVCIIEAMKVMNEILADVDGEIVEILVKNGSPVEYGQPLFKVKLAK